MAECCHTSTDELGTPTKQTGTCPGCGKKGKPVATLTVKNLVTEHTRVSPSVSYLFCRTPTCNVVYFSTQASFTKTDLKVRVGIKESMDPIPLCYCFGYTKEDIRRDLGSNQASTILENIKTEVQKGFCACEVKNPSGTCCLGDVTRAIQESK